MTSIVVTVKEVRADPAAGEVPSVAALYVTTVDDARVSVFFWTAEAAEALAREASACAARLREYERSLKTARRENET